LLPALLSLLPLLTTTLSLLPLLSLLTASLALLPLLTALAFLSLLTTLLTALLPLLPLLAVLLLGLTVALTLALLKSALIPLRSAVLLLTVLLLTVLLAVRLLPVLLLATGLLLPVLLLSVLLAAGLLLTILLLAVLLLAILLALATGGAVLLRALAHAFVHRLQAADQIARLVSRLRILPLRVASLRRGLGLLQPLTKIGDVAGDLLLRLTHPIRRRVSRLLLRVPQLLFDLSTANRVSGVLECA